MARTVIQIVQEIVAQQVMTIASLQAQLETAKEQLANYEATASSPVSERVSPAPIRRVESA